MLTLADARNLRKGDVLIDRQGGRWRVSGNVQTWKRDPARIRVPVKHGLYSHDAITESMFTTNGVCTILTKEGTPQ